MNEKITILTTPSSSSSSRLVHPICSHDTEAPLDEHTLLEALFTPCSRYPDQSVQLSLEIK